MSKYKAGDKVLCEYILDEIDANDLNNERVPDFSFTKIIAHEPAPEPIVRYLNMSEILGYDTDFEGQIKVTITGNDVTLDKVKQ